MFSLLFLLILVLMVTMNLLELYGDKKKLQERAAKMKG